MTTADAIGAWRDEFKAAARKRGFTTVSGDWFTVDDVYITIVTLGVTVSETDPDRLRLGWAMQIKPLAVDEVLWAAFMPDLEMGPRMRLNRRVNGEFSVPPLNIANGMCEVPAAQAPDWTQVLDDIERARVAFVTEHPTAEQYVTALEADDAVLGSGRDVLRAITALIAADRNADAARAADEAIGRGERGPYSSTTDVLKYLRAYASGPEAYASFRDSLRPTHDSEVIAEAGYGSASALSRARHRGAFDRHLRSLDGTNRWAYVLTVRPPAGQPDDHTTMRYLQAAGTAGRMLIEVCLPGGAEFGAVTVRSIVGRPGAGAEERDVAIELPHSTERVASAEVFAFAEATELFEAFYRNDELPAGYELRPVEGWTADADSVEFGGSAD